MNPGSLKIATALAIIGIAICPALFGQQPRKPLTNGEVFRMVEAGVPESAIITSIQSSPNKFEITDGTHAAFLEAGRKSKVPVDTINSIWNAMIAGKDGSTSAVPGSSSKPAAGALSGGVQPGSQALALGVKHPKLPPIKSNPERDAAAPADAAAKAEIAAKIEQQFAAFKSTHPVKSLHNVVASENVSEIQALKRQKVFAEAQLTSNTLAKAGSSSLKPGLALSTDAATTGAIATTPALTAPTAPPSERPAGSATAQYQPPSGTNPKAVASAATKSSVVTPAGPPSERPAGSAVAQYQPPSGGNPRAVETPNTKMCLIAQIYRVNNATSGVVFTQDPAYNDYFIDGCGFGDQGGQVYLSGAITNGRVGMVVKQWSPGRIEVMFQPGLAGVMDGWPDLIVAPTGAGVPIAKFPNCRFYAQRQSVTLPSISQNYARLANSQSALTEYCPVGNQLGACLSWYPNQSISKVTNGVDRNSTWTGPSFNPGQDVYDLSHMTPGFVVDGARAMWYVESVSVCHMWSQNARIGDSFNNSTQGTYDTYVNGSNQVVVEWGVDHCSWHWLGIYSIEEFYGAGYSLEVSVTGAIGVDPWTGKPTN